LDGSLWMDTRVVCGGGSILGCVLEVVVEFDFLDSLVEGRSWLLWFVPGFVVLWCFLKWECLTIGLHLHHHAPVIGWKCITGLIVAMVVGARPHWLLPFAIVENLWFWEQQLSKMVRGNFGGVQVQGEMYWTVFYEKNTHWYWLFWLTFCPI